VSEDQDWRLLAEVDAGGGRGAVDRIVGGLRGADAQNGEGSVPSEVVITHDGERLFAYAASQEALSEARDAIERALARDDLSASITVSHWDEELDAWRQVDPPPSEEQRRAQAAADRDGDAVETRTFVASAGRWVREEFEQSMRDWAERLGLECAIIEHPHLLTTQVGFTVTGPKRKIDEFSRAINAEGRATIRTETGVMISPL